MTIQQQQNENKTMAQILSLSPVEFTVYIRRIEVDQVPKGEEAEWLRELYQRKDKRFDQLLNQETELSELDQAKRQILDTPINSKCNNNNHYYTCSYNHFVKTCLSRGA